MGFNPGTGCRIKPGPNTAHVFMVSVIAWDMENSPKKKFNETLVAKLGQKSDFFLNNSSTTFEKKHMLLWRKKQDSC